MKLREYLSQEKIFCGVSAGTREELVEKLVELTSRFSPEIDKKQAVAAILERESQFSSGIGGGIAVPHAIIPTAGRTTLAVANINGGGVDFRSVDGAPCMVAFMLLSPDGSAEEHIRILARITKLCFRREFIEKMSRAATPKELYRVVADEDKLLE